MNYKKPYSGGWEKLTVEQRIENWLGINQCLIGENRIEDFKNFLLNFSASYEALNANTLEQLAYETRDQEYEFWTDIEKELLW
ncbi:hypothetical protein KY342_05080, partial [Candidatus Woesearchaeota archaeon]|nr:hypothetical protein [Candidatus Woesearchaeota archaeon]